MVRIVCGPIGGGKTTHLWNHWRQNRQGGGFVSQKILEGTAVKGYRLLDLAGGGSALFALRREFTGPDWDEGESRADFSFSASGLEFARALIADALDRRLEPIYIDEIGALELEGRGLANAFVRALAQGGELWVAVRDSRLDAVLRQFAIGRHELIRL